MEKKVVGRGTLLKSGFWYVLSMFLTKGMVFITMPIFTRLLSKEEYGNFSVFTSWQAIFLVICSVELYSTLNRARFDYPEKKDFHQYITSCLCLSVLITGVLFAAYLLFPHFFDRLLLLDRSYMYVMFAYLLTVPAIYLFQMEQRIEYRYKTSSAISIGAALISPLLAITAVFIMKDSDPLFGRIIGQCILYIILGTVFFTYYVCRSSKPAVKCWRYALRFGVPLVFSHLGSRILLSADVIVLKHMCSATEVSYLSVTHTTSQIVLVLVQTLNLAWAPWFYDMLKSYQYSEIKKIFRLYIWIMIFLTFALLLIGPEVILILAGGGYKESVYILPPNILCGVFTVITANAVYLETYLKKPEYAAILTAGMAIVNIGLDILGVKLWGYRAVCYTTVFCQLILVALHYHVTRPMGMMEILPLKSLIPALGATLILIPVSLLLYQSNLIRYIMIAVICVTVLSVLIHKRKEIVVLIRRFRKQKKEA